MRERLACGLVLLSAVVGCRSGEIGMRRDGASVPADGPPVAGDAAPDGGTASDAVGADDGATGTDGAGPGDSGGGDTIPVPPGWELVWSEEFDTPGMPDPATWGYEVGYVRSNEDQYYNLAIGGAWGGQHGVDDSIFPARYSVDYVRYYHHL